MHIPDHVMFSRRLAELAGESRDRNMQPLLETQAEKLIDELFDGIYTLATEWFDANISLVINLEQNPGTIFLGKDEAMEYFKQYYYESGRKGKWYQSNIVLVTADRGRVTSYLEQFSVQHDRDEINPVGPMKKEVILITMDLNDSKKIQRMKFRLLCKEDDVGQMPDRNWDDAIDTVKTKPVVIDYNI